MYRERRESGRDVERDVVRERQRDVKRGRDKRKERDVESLSYKRRERRRERQRLISIYFAKGIGRMAQ